MKWKLILLLTLFVATNIYGQNKSIIKSHKFYDTTKVEDFQKVKSRRMTVDVDSTGIGVSVWGDECRMDISLLTGKETSLSYDVNALASTPYVKYGDDNIQYKMYINEGGNFEFDAIIKRGMPKGQYEIPLEIQTNGLSFYYQPELTQEEIDFGAIRPDSVIGSYAVYHNSKRNNIVQINKNDTTYENYQIGKAFHIYRPRVWDNAGDTLWGTLEIDSNLMIIGVDSTWLAKAKYPVTIDPNFGYESTPASLLSTSPAMAMIGDPDHIYTASTGDVITSYTGYFAEDATGDQTISLIAYSMSAGLPDSRIATAEVVTISSTTFAWYQTGAVSHSMSNGVTYCVAMGDESHTALWTKYDTGSGTNKSNNSDGTLPASWSSAGTGSNRIGIYATYTAGGGDETGTWVHSPTGSGSVHSSGGGSVVH